MIYLTRKSPTARVIEEGFSRFKAQTEGAKLALEMAREERERHLRHCWLCRLAERLH